MCGIPFLICYPSTGLPPLGLAELIRGHLGCFGDVFEGVVSRGRWRFYTEISHCSLELRRGRKWQKRLLISLVTCAMRSEEKAQLFPPSTPSTELLLLMLGPEAFGPLWIQGGHTERRPKESLERLNSPHADRRFLTTTAICPVPCPVWGESYRGPPRLRAFSSKSTFLDIFGTFRPASTLLCLLWLPEHI